MPSMDLPYHSHAQLLMPPGPVFSAPPLHNSMALNGSVPLPPPPRHPPPTWSQSNKIHKKRGGFNSKRNIRGPSTNVNIKRLRQQNARKTRKYFNKGAAARPATPRTVPPAPYNSNSFLCHDTARRDGYAKPHRGQYQQHRRHKFALREQTPSVIQTPNTLSDRLNLRPEEASWTAGGEALTSEQVALATSFNPADSGLQLNEFDSETDEEDTSTAGSDADEDRVLVQGSRAYERLPSAVRRKLQELEGEVERLHDENQRLRERIAFEDAAAGDASEMSADC